MASPTLPKRRTSILTTHLPTASKSALGRGSSHNGWPFRSLLLFFLLSEAQVTQGAWISSSTFSAAPCLTWGGVRKASSSGFLRQCREKESATQPELLYLAAGGWTGQASSTWWRGEEGWRSFSPFLLCSGSWGCVLLSEDKKDGWQLDISM